MDSMQDEPYTLEQASEMIADLRCEVMDYEEMLAPLQERVTMLQDRLDLYDDYGVKATRTRMMPS